MSSRGWKSLPNKYRLVFVLALMMSGYFLPIAFFAVVAMVGMIVFDNFFEPAGLLFFGEAVYGLPADSWSPYPFLATIVCILAVLIIQEIKGVILIK